MHVETIPNRRSPPAILLRESYRENGKVRKRTLANLSNWPAEKLQALRAVLRGDRLLPAGEGGFEICRSLPHGHVIAALATARRISLDDLLPRRGIKRHRDLAFGLIIARLLDPAAKLATARMLDTATASHSLGEVLGLGHVKAREIYATLDWLGSEQPFIARQPWPAAISPTVRWCCMMSPPPTWRAAAAPWHSTTTAAIAGPIGRSWSSDCCVLPTAARWRSRCSRAIPLIRPH
jgi:hypothetical protein